MWSLVRQALVIGLITLLLGEASARWVVGLSPLSLEPLVWRAHPERGWAHLPGATERFVRLGFSQDIRINSMGLRERDIPFARTPGVQRVLVIGDSGVASFEVEREQVFTRVAERELARRGLRVEFLNAGCRGYGTDQTLLFLRDEGMRYAPDLVLYRYSPNDSEDIRTVHKSFRRYGKSWFDMRPGGELLLLGVPVPRFPYTQALYVDERGELVEREVPAGARARLWLRDHVAARSALAAGLLHVAATLPGGAERLRHAGSTGDLTAIDPHPDRDSRTYRLLVALVAEMQRVAQAGGARFLLIGPGRAWTTEIMSDLELPDPRDWERFRERVPEGVRTTAPFDPHLNAVGHEIYGTVLAEALLEHRLLELQPEGG